MNEVSSRARQSATIRVDDRLIVDDDTLTPILVSLGPIERWTLDLVRRRGIGGFATMMGAVAVAASLLTVWTSLLLLDGFSEPPSVWVPALVLGAVIPATVAPPMLAYSARLIARLDETTHLLHESAITDSLTGVANRRGFFAALDRTDGDVEVAMVDLDDFKVLNDRSGHAFGDAVLRAVAAWLVEVVGDDGTVGRIGGDEFACFSPVGVLGQVPGQQRFILHGIEFTVSIGVARGSDRRAALLAADADLYRRKRLDPLTTDRVV